MKKERLVRPSDTHLLRQARRPDIEAENKYLRRQLLELRTNLENGEHYSHLSEEMDSVESSIKCIEPLLEKLSDMDFETIIERLEKIDEKIEELEKKLNEDEDYYHAAEDATN